MSDKHVEKITSLNLYKFFKQKKPRYIEWKINIEGEEIVIDNARIMDSILQAPLEEQEILADALNVLQDEGGDVNEFLRFLSLGGMNSYR